MIWERFYEFVFTDPVLLTVALLITIRYRLECLGYRNRAKDFMQVLQLEDFLIKRVNAALKQPGRAVSDPMLVAVALCAAYEVKNGNPSAYHIHMKGLLRMIDLRGGLAKIGEEDPYLERLLIWHDVNTSRLSGMKAISPTCQTAWRKFRGLISQHLRLRLRRMLRVRAKRVLLRSDAMGQDVIHGSSVCRDLGARHVFRTEHS